MKRTYVPLQVFVDKKTTHSWDDVARVPAYVYSDVGVVAIVSVEQLSSKLQLSSDLILLYFGFSNDATAPLDFIAVSDARVEAKSNFVLQFTRSESLLTPGYQFVSEHTHNMSEVGSDLDLIVDKVVLADDF